MGINIRIPVNNTENNKNLGNYLQISEHKLDRIVVLRRKRRSIKKKLQCGPSKIGHGGFGY